MPRCDDDTLTAEMPYAVRDFLKYLEAGLRALGSELNAALNAPAELCAAGFTGPDETNSDINGGGGGGGGGGGSGGGGMRVTSVKCPIGDWPRDPRLRACGVLMRDSSVEGLRGLAQRPFINGLGWTALQVEIFLVDVRKASNDSRLHTYFHFHVVCAQKPLSTTAVRAEGDGE